jgi:prepilin-type N-terminal cleavage/methylation domain-containing protein
MPNTIDQPYGKRKHQSGFTAIEILISSVILGMVIITSYGFWRYFSESFQFSFGKSVSLSDVSRTTQRMVRELREAQESESGAYPLDTVLDNEIVFYADVDDDGQSERVHYWLDNNLVLRGIVEPTGDPPVYDPGSEAESIMVEGVVNQLSEPLFTYYNADWPSDVINNPLMINRQLDTRLIKLTLSISAEVDKTASPSTITNSVMLRRLKNI